MKEDSSHFLVKVQEPVRVQFSAARCTKFCCFFFVVLTHYEARNWINFLFIICLAVIAFIDVFVFFNLSTNIHDKCGWVLWYNYWAAGVAVSLRRGFIEPKGSSINDNFFLK